MQVGHVAPTASMSISEKMMWHEFGGYEFVEQEEDEDEEQDEQNEGEEED